MRTLHAIVEELTEQLRLIRIEREPKRGMHVPYHGAFVAAPPSVLRDLERLRDELLSVQVSDIERIAVAWISDEGTDKTSGDACTPESYDKLHALIDAVLRRYPELSNG